VLCDSGQRYGSKIYDPAFLAARNLPTPQWMS
jgi:cysteine synthase A